MDRCWIGQVDVINLLNQDREIYVDKTLSLWTDAGRYSKKRPKSKTDLGISARQNEVEKKRVFTVLRPVLSNASAVRIKRQ